MVTETRGARRRQGYHTGTTPSSSATAEPEGSASETTGDEPTSEMGPQTPQDSDVTPAHDEGAEGESKEDDDDVTHSRATPGVMETIAETRMETLPHLLVLLSVALLAHYTAVPVSDAAYSFAVLLFVTFATLKHFARMKTTSSKAWSPRRGSTWVSRARAYFGVFGPLFWVVTSTSIQLHPWRHIVLLIVELVALDAMEKLRVSPYLRVCSSAAFSARRLSILAAWVIVAAHTDMVPIPPRAAATITSVLPGIAPWLQPLAVFKLRASASLALAVWSHQLLSDVLLHEAPALCRKIYTNPVS